jgi:ParB/RepB/Spo0J family partition protein
VIRLNLDRTELLPNGLRYAPDAGILLAPSARLKNDPRQPRRHFPQDDLDRLRADIDFWRKQGRGLAGTGFLEALACRWAPGSSNADGSVKKNAKLIIWDGERRWRATKDDYEWLPVVLDDLSAKEARSAALRTSIHKALLLPIEEGHAFAQEMKDDGASLRVLAKKYSVDKSYIENRVGLLRCPDDVQRFVSEHPDKMSHGLALRDVTDKALRAELIDLAIHGTGVRELQQSIDEARAERDRATETRRAPDRETQARQSRAAQSGSAPVSRGRQITAHTNREATQEARSAVVVAHSNINTARQWIENGGAVPKNELITLRRKIDELLEQ